MSGIAFNKCDEIGYHTSHLSSQWLNCYQRVRLGRGWLHSFGECHPTSWYYTPSYSLAQEHFHGFLKPQDKNRASLNQALGREPISLVLNRTAHNPLDSSLPYQRPML